MTLTLPRPLAAFRKTLPADGRLYQIVFLSTFLLVGLFFRDWSTDLWRYATIMGTALATQAVCVALTTRDFTTLKSALITSLGLSLLLRANEPSTLMLGAGAAILSKFVFRYRGKHFFNPANFGIAVATLFTHDAWVSPGQWGADILLVFVFGCLGMMVVGKVGRLDTTVTFLLVFFSLQYLRTVVYFGWPADHLWHQFTNGAFWLFSFFMITDPRSIPDNRYARVGWTAAIAVLAFLLSNWLLPLKIPFFVHTAAIWSLFVFSPITPLLDRLFPARRFEWTPTQNTPAR